MRPILIRLPWINLPLFGFGIMLLCGFLAGLYLANRRARKIGLPEGLIDDLALWIIIGGLVGARGFYLIQHWQRVGFRGPLDLLALWQGGIVFYGSVIGGVVSILIYWKLRPFPLLATLDVLAPAVALGVGIGRLGCFLNGCCYGDVCSLPWALRFPPGSDVWWHQIRTGELAGISMAVIDQVERGIIPATTVWSLPVHPTQLYSAIDGFVLCAVLSAYFPLRKRDGQVIALFMMLYPVTRFLIEQLRSDEAAIFLGMTISQSISLAVLLGGAALFLWLHRLPPQRFEDRDDPTLATDAPAPIRAGSSV
jgi:phosphatidylglycerol:prolipoprotein diacylglycerol transferase